MMWLAEGVVRKDSVVLIRFLSYKPLFTTTKDFRRAALTLKITESTQS